MEAEAKSEAEAKTEAEAEARVETKVESEAETETETEAEAETETEAEAEASSTLEASQLLLKAYQFSRQNLAGKNLSLIVMTLVARKIIANGSACSFKTSGFAKIVQELVV